MNILKRLKRKLKRRKLSKKRSDTVKEYYQKKMARIIRLMKRDEQNLRFGGLGKKCYKIRQEEYIKAYKEYKVYI